MKNKIDLIIALGISVLISMACNFSYSTANLGDLKFGRDKDAKNSGTSFNPQDEIFAVTSVNNSGGKNKVKFRLLFDDVEGAKTGTVAYKLDKELEVEGSRAVWFNFSVPSGIVPGSYKVEAILTDEEGKELDRKIENFTVKGEVSRQTTQSRKRSSGEANNEEDTDQEDKVSEDN